MPGNTLELHEELFMDKVSENGVYFRLVKLRVWVFRAILDQMEKWNNFSPRRANMAKTTPSVV